MLPAEKQLREACRTGEIAEIGEIRPEEKTEDNSLRAAFLRFLALGGDSQTPVHEHGVQIVGAWIKGELDLQSAAIPSNFAIVHCRFDTEPVLRDAKIDGTLHLGGSWLPGMQADRLVCDGSVFLRNGFESQGEVRLHGAQIGGGLSCVKGKFAGGEGNALLADGIVVKGSVFLRDGFTAQGEVRLLGAQIDGSLDCNDGKFEVKEGDALSADNVEIKGSVFLTNNFSAKGVVRLDHAQIDGSLECSKAKFEVKKGDALVADGMMVKGAFFFRKLVAPASGISLTAAQVGLLVDDEASWGENLTLDGFNYGSLAGSATAMTRLKWLSKQHPGHYGITDAGRNFRPQPWQQLIRTLRTMGHQEEARQVAIVREVHLRKIGLIGQTPPGWNKATAWVYRHTVQFLHRSFGALIGYGHRPLRLCLWMLLVWLGSGFFYWSAAQQAVFAPSNPLVFNHPDYQHCSPDPKKQNSKSKVGNWFICQELAEEYTTFSPLAYSLDLILPLVDLQQEHDWAPIIPTPKAKPWDEWRHFSLGHLTRLVVWSEILFGWIASLLLVAVLSGLTNRERE